MFHFLSTTREASEAYSTVAKKKWSFRSIFRDTMLYLDYEINQFQTDKFLESLHPDDLPFYSKVTSVLICFVTKASPRKQSFPRSRMSFKFVFTKEFYVCSPPVWKTAAKVLLRHRVSFEDEF